jgi:sodium transport system permease protein
LLAAVPLCLFTAALQATVATMSRSFKEAQSYMGVLMLGPMLPGLVASLYPIGSTLWLNGVPLLGSFLLLSDTLSGRPPRAAEFLTSAAVSFALTVGLLRVTTRLFRSEHIIFGR